MSSGMDKAVILARGLGTRMRKGDSTAQLDAKQAAIADTGLKAMIPIDRPFLDYVMHALAEAGYRRICLVIGPEHTQVRDYYGPKLSAKRLSVDFAIQEKPLGTGNAVLAAEAFSAGEPFLVINSDNYYPPESFKALRDLTTPGLAGFERKAMLQGSNIPADRLVKFAVAIAGADGFLTKIVEKPAESLIASLPEPVCLSMNCWRFDATIFPACRSIPLSPRNEYEIPDAVQYSMEKLGARYKVLTCRAPVLDLSSRSDIAAVAAKLKGTEVKL